jgi:PiT family inorganic phosphate transporter
VAQIVSYLELVPGLALCVVLGANNLSTCLGMSMGARAIRYSEALLLASVGLLAGLFLEGHKLSGAITSGIAQTSNITFSSSVALSTLIIMALLTYRRLPISLSQVAVGAAVGAAFAQGTQINWTFTLIVIVSWLLTPVVGFTIAILLSLLSRRLTVRIKNIIAVNMFYGYLTVISGIYASYALGANTVGLIVGLANMPASQHLLVSVAFGFATIVGMILFSRGTTRSVAENIVGLSTSASFATQMGGAITVHGFTQFGIPVSVSQAVVGGIFGAALPRKIVVRNARLTREILLGWTVAPLLGAGVALAIALALQS